MVRIRQRANLKKMKSKVKAEKQYEIEKLNEFEKENEFEEENELEKENEFEEENELNDTSNGFEAELAALGLKIVPVAADGNCFFRAIADQLDGDEEEHEKYREMVVLYIMDHREDFEPFVEDDMNFEEYMESMKKSGTWAGHMEIQAASLVTRANICIHTLRSPRVHIRNFDTADTRTLHLSYHDGNHYNSLYQDGLGQDLPRSFFNVDGQSESLSEGE